MRIAFVGKGGSGKSTLAALFANYANNSGINTFVVDADINMHQAGLLGFKIVPKEKHLSNTNSVRKIKEYLIGKNERIIDDIHFKKTTPPTTNSNLVHWNNLDNFILKEFLIKIDNISLLTVGTYEDEGIGASCYHTSLMSFENILSHSVDKNELIICDMVAGVDAFANTLHMQFDYLILAVEPTVRSVDVFNQYKRLSEKAGILKHLKIIGNKVRNKSDEEFIKKQISANFVLGFLYESEYLREIDQNPKKLDFSKLETKNKRIFVKILELVKSSKNHSKERYEILLKLHEKYIRKFFPDKFDYYMTQIDPLYEIK